MKSLSRGRALAYELERACEADFYHATYNLKLNAKDDALKLLQSAALGCPRDFLEQSAAKMELAGLRGPTK